MPYNKIHVEPITGTIGAEISGVDLQNLSAETIAEIRSAFLEHVVIFFRDQPLDIPQLKTFTSHFGSFGIEPYVKTMTEHPEVIAVVKEADEVNTINFGGHWHSDWSFQEAPPMATILHSQDIPPYGGDTVFANMYLAYETLSDGMKAIIDPLIAIHSARRPYGTGKSILGNSKRKSMTILHSEDAHAEMEHPVVRIHPETGRKALFVNPVYTTRLKGMSETDSREILDKLFHHSVREIFTCRFRWRVNSLAMWDNRAAMHLALNDYDGFRRALNRTTVAGDRPFGSAMRGQQEHVA
ncbi:TauD/TfdA dioxygenase family protein [Sneathiella sp.]|uniref:TauD/TfdA dioxygenase family protein n=1 Tax=Sneathiella sp. TaxID=1964365 RepID=UPI003569F8FF